MNAEDEFGTFAARGSKLLRSLGLQVSCPDGIGLWLCGCLLASGQ